MSLVQELNKILFERQQRAEDAAAKTSAGADLDAASDTASDSDIATVTGATDDAVTTTAADSTAGGDDVSVADSDYQDAYEPVIITADQLLLAIIAAVAATLKVSVKPVPDANLAPVQAQMDKQNNLILKSRLEFAFNLLDKSIQMAVQHLQLRTQVDEALQAYHQQLSTYERHKLEVANHNVKLDWLRRGLLGIYVLLVIAVVLILGQDYLNITNKDIFAILAITIAGSLLIHPIIEALFSHKKVDESLMPERPTLPAATLTLDVDLQKFENSVTAALTDRLGEGAAAEAEQVSQAVSKTYLTTFNLASTAEADPDEPSVPTYEKGLPVNVDTLRNKLSSAAP